MSLDLVLEQYPKEIKLKDGFTCALRPLESHDEIAFHEFFLAVPTQERMFIKHRVTEPEVIHEWCQNIDLGRNLPLLACRSCLVAAPARTAGSRALTKGANRNTAAQAARMNCKNKVRPGRRGREVIVLAFCGLARAHETEQGAYHREELEP